MSMLVLNWSLIETFKIYAAYLENYFRINGCSRFKSKSFRNKDDGSYQLNTVSWFDSTKYKKKK